MPSTRGTFLAALIFASLIIAFGVISIFRGEGEDASLRFLAGLVRGIAWLAIFAAFLLVGSLGSRIALRLWPPASRRKRASGIIASLIGLSLGALAFVAALHLLHGVRIFGERIL